MSNFSGFIGPAYTLDSVQFDCQRSINLYVEPDEAKGGTDGNYGQLVATPGLYLAVLVASGVSSIRGLYQSTTGEVYAAAGNAVYQITETLGVFTATSIGTLQTASGYVNFADNAGLLWIVDGPNGYVWQNSTFTQINDPSWQGADYVVVLADQFIFNVPGTNEFYWSDINAPTFTLAGGYGVDAKQGNSDPIISMQVYGLFLWLVGSQTTEIWTTNPGATTSYQRIPGPYLQTGCLAGQTFQYTEYGGIWLSQNPRGGAQVVMTPPQAYTVQRISTFAVEQALQQYSQADIELSTGFFYQQKGHIFYQLNPGGQNALTSWVYDVTVSEQLQQPIWHERTFTPVSNIQTRHLADNHAVLNGYHLVGDYSNGNLYVLDPSTYTDNGFTITRTRISPHVAEGFNRVFHHALTIEMTTGLGTGCDIIGPSAPGTGSGSITCGTDFPTLSWEPSTPGTYPIYAYNLYRGISSTGPWLQIGQVLNIDPYNNTPNDLVYTDYNTDGVNYYYYVAAQDNQGNTTPSAVQHCSSEWSLVYTGSGSGNSNGGAFQSIVTNDVGTYSMVTGGPGTVSSSDGGNTWASNTTFPGPNAPGTPLFNGTYFVALDAFGTQQAYFSTDLQTWTTDGNNLGVYQLTQDIGTGAIYAVPYTSSSNVVLWRNAPNSNSFTKVLNEVPGPSPTTYGNLFLTAGGITVSSYGRYPNYAAWWSTDGGVTWTESASSLTGNDFYGLAYNGAIWLLVAATFTPPDYPTTAYTSTDGKNWTLVDTTTTAPPFDAPIVTFGNKFIQWYGTELYTSTDGITWTTINIPGILSIQGVTPSSTRVYVWGIGGIYESTDGVTYTASVVTMDTNDVDASGLPVLAITSTMGSSPVNIYKRT